MNRGDVVIVDFRPTVPLAGVRPALIIQNDCDNAQTMLEIDECLKAALAIVGFDALHPCGEQVLPHPSPAR